jgi:hypothetical protein
MARNVLLIGSIPLASADAVFEAVGRELDGLVRRVPDGEIGERHDWVAWQSAAFGRIPFIERVEAARLAAVGVDNLPKGPQYRVRPGFPTAAVRFGPLGYADAAAQSYRAFTAARAARKLPAGCRFQVGIATALSVVGQYVDGAFQAAIEPAYEQRLLEEVDEIAKAVPRGDLAIQWNLATELSIIEGRRPVYFGKVWDGIFERVVRACERVPDGVELGLHFCFRDFEFHGFPLPGDLDGIVDLANGLSGSVGRSIEWMHFPVPAGTTDAVYFAPLRRLTLRDETDLYLGVIHAGREMAETARQVACAASAVPGFGIACECGFGDIAGNEVAGLLRTHRACAEAG